MSAVQVFWKHFGKRRMNELIVCGIMPCSMLFQLHIMTASEPIHAFLCYQQSMRNILSKLHAAFQHKQHWNNGQGLERNILKQWLFSVLQYVLAVQGIKLATFCSESLTPPGGSDWSTIIRPSWNECKIFLYDTTYEMYVTRVSTL